MKRSVLKKPASKFLRLTPFQRGMIFMGFLTGMTQPEIAAEVQKTDGSNPTAQAVSDTISHAQANGGAMWNGQLQSGAGRPRESTTKLDKAITKFVFKRRGSIKVTATVVRRFVKESRGLSVRTIQRRIADAGLRYLRRRQKYLISAAHKQDRLEWVAWVSQRTTAMLSKWAFTDGTSFYLARSDSEYADKRRLALGSHVWRAANGHDALFEDCVGPSTYAKAQGNCVRVWGLLFAGILCVYVLPQGMVMNTEIYTWLIEHKFRLWLDLAFARATKVFLVQDHEKCLWADEPVDALEDENIELLTNYPKSSQDLNPIETAWRELKSRLDVTMPEAFESRPQFVQRLHQAVAWVNKNRRDYFLKICRSQKAWARDVLEATPPGARTNH